MSSSFKLFLIFVVLVIVAVYLFFQLVPQTADTLYVNGRVYTMNAANTVAEAIAIQGDRIVAVGSTSEIQKKFKAKNIIDLHGKSVFPGLIDAHGHMMSLGISKLTVDLVGSSSETEAAARVKERVDQSKPERWIRGRGWDQNRWQSKKFPTHEALDKVAPNNPVLLSRVDGHAIWVNKRALEIAEITKATPDPDGGKIVRDAQGNPTGVFVDNAMRLVGKFLPPLSDEEATQAINLAVQECLQYGITTVHDMGVDAKEIELYQRLIDNNQFPFRVYAAIGGAGRTWSQYIGTDSSGIKKQQLIGYGGNKLWVRAIKLYIDGALGSRGAALLEPYSDDPGNRGLTVTSEETLRKTIDEALLHGFQVLTHAIGDRGNNIVLNTYEAALKAHPVSVHRLRVEHAQVLYANDIPRFNKLGVIPSMQPTHCTSDMYWAEARLGSTRIFGAYAWRSLLETGVIIAGGSDFPVEYVNPMFGIYAAVSRQDQQGKPRNAEDVRTGFQLSQEGIKDPSAFDGGWYASQKMTREEAIRSFTSWAAYAGFQENLLGSLEKGKLADFIILRRDIMTVQPLEIVNTVVERTFVGGKEVYNVNAREGAK